MFVTLALFLVVCGLAPAAWVAWWILASAVERAAPAVRRTPPVPGRAAAASGRDGLEIRPG
jgi:hypothetical protein